MDVKLRAAAACFEQHRTTVSNKLVEIFCRYRGTEEIEETFGFCFGFEVKASFYRHLLQTSRGNNSVTRVTCHTARLGSLNKRPDRVSHRIGSN